MQKLNLLIIDDDQDVLKLLTREFKRAKFGVITTSSPDEALDLIFDEDIGVVMCDLNLPSTSGIELLRQIREKQPEIVRILLTADADVRSVVDAVNGGAIYKFVQKPWRPREIRQIVKDAFQHYHETADMFTVTNRLKVDNERLAQFTKDLEERMREAEGELLRTRYFDELTQLPNRAFLKKNLEEVIKVSGESNAGICVLIVGLDRFKRLNQSFGKATGDRVLLAMVKMLRSQIRKEDILGRWSGDKFAVLLRDADSCDDPAKVARRILDGVSKPFTIGEEQLSLTASVGIAVYPVNGKDADALLHNGETAMHQAKAHGGGTFVFFKSDLDIQVRKQLNLESQLRRAIANHEFELFYQPRVDSESLTIIGAEALLRWRHPERGIVPPNEFIPALEDTGLISTVGEWTIYEACAAMHRWADRHLPAIRVSVNLSPVEIQRSNLRRIIELALGTHSDALTPDRLEVEVTEGTLIDDVQRAKLLLQSLKEMGIHLAIDDFGTGYSALNYLVQFPFDVLKIDMSFVRSLGANKRANAVARSIVSLAQNLNLSVVAEGVEADAQVQALRVLGCDEFQGYLFGRPSGEQEFVELLAKNSVIAPVEAAPHPTPLRQQVA